MSSRLTLGVCPPMNLKYGIAVLKGGFPSLRDRVVDVPSFTVMSRPTGMGYFGVFDGFFGASSTTHLAERLHVAIAKGIVEELVAEAPRHLEFPDDVEGWWKRTFLDAFRVVDDELVARVAVGVPVGPPAVIAVVLKDFIVFANRGETCMAVIGRGKEAVKLTSESRPVEQQNAQNAGGHVAGSTCNLQDHRATSRAISSRPYFPEPEVMMVERKPRDKFMILATGGVWDHITPVEACNFIQNRLCASRIMPGEIADSNVSPDILAKELAELAINKGSQRNATVAIIFFKIF